MIKNFATFKISWFPWFVRIKIDVYVLLKNLIGQINYPLGNSVDQSPVNPKKLPSVGDFLPIGVGR